MSNKRLNYIYHAMKNRCYDTKHQSYKYYGARGIEVCKDWLNSYQSFKKWAFDNGYGDNLTLDRVDTNKNYSPDNCRWVTMKEQANNKRNNHFIMYKGELKTVAEWCRTLNLNYNSVKTRLRLGFTPEEALTAKSYKEKCIKHNGKEQNITEWCKELGLDRNKIYSYLRSSNNIQNIFKLKGGKR